MGHGIPGFSRQERPYYPRGITIQQFTESRLPDLRNSSAEELPESVCLEASVLLLAQLLYRTRRPQTVAVNALLIARLRPGFSFACCYRQRFALRLSLRSPLEFPSGDSSGLAAAAAPSPVAPLGRSLRARLPGAPARLTI